MRIFSLLLHSRTKCASWLSSSPEIVARGGPRWVGSAGAFHGARKPVMRCESRPFSSVLPSVSSEALPGISWEGSSFPLMLRKLELTLGGDSVEEAWEAFNSYRVLHGFPAKGRLSSKMITLLSYSRDPRWLDKGYKLVLAIRKKKKHHLLFTDPLMKLALTLARSEMPIPASTVMRIMLEKGEFPSKDIWDAMFFHLVKTEVGSHLASDVLVEICDLALDHNLDPSRKGKKRLLLPNLQIFNLVLDSCVEYGSHLKAYKILELMALLGIEADACSLLFISRIYDMIGLRDELGRPKKHVDVVCSVTSNRHYLQFYDSLLSLHFKYNDIDAAAEVMSGFYGSGDLVHGSNCEIDKSSPSERYCTLQIGPSHLRTGSKLMIQLKDNHSVVTFVARRLSGFLFCDGEKLIPSQKAIAKVVNGYVTQRRVDKLSGLLISMHNRSGRRQSELISDVIDSCIQLGWLEAAHDIIDDLGTSGISVCHNSYILLLKAYHEKGMLGEFKLLLNQMRKRGDFSSLSDEGAMSLVRSEHGAIDCQDAGNLSLVRKSYLAELLGEESREEYFGFDSVYQFNASILFFCKAGMMNDSMRTFKRMQQRNVGPTVETFSHLINGYSSLKMYRQITILWGDIKRRLEDGVLAANRDLFESLLWNFLKGGYFERVMEIISYMMNNNMYADKWKYRSIFLKLHKDLYRKFKMSEASTEAQGKRLNDVRTFRKWVGLRRR